ncbi:hypothetical protein E8E12_007427 [Didymella heteroderae]|uniref:Aminoglycoside phosphotransferase domain-containing protein n=1 Tax=Didymella heteroderae TaxID=1769908 RepID=A0A9P5C0Z4_9PLEO|nr:hypothetical protein E8E12_007427 [Didymella heteroderae]
MAIWQDNFWARIGLQETDKAKCIEAVKRRYDRHHVEEFECQGYCSFTLLVSWLEDSNNFERGSHSDAGTFAPVVVQFRPAQHALDVDIAREASRLYPSLAPKVRALDLYLPGNLYAYELSRLPGKPLSGLLPHKLLPGTELRAKQETLVTSFAHVVAQGWPSKAGKQRRDSVVRADSPSMEKQSMLLLCTGKVGSCVTQKLQKLVRELPVKWLRERAMITLDNFCVLEDYPIVLNHGDLIPSNILVDEQTWEITGLVDWAEAEQLPFGTCLFGLEHLLGFVQLSSPNSTRPVFAYQEDAVRLRQLFWTTLISVVPELEGRQGEVQAMRDMGVLLWHGYAWDEGAIDRVVDEVNDGEELAKLRAFLSV